MQQSLKEESKKEKPSILHFFQINKESLKSECAEEFTHTYNKLTINLQKIIYETHIKIDFSLTIIKDIGSPEVMKGSSDISDKITFKALVEASSEGFNSLIQAMEQLPKLDPNIDPESWDILLQVVDKMRRYEKNLQKLQEQEPVGLQLTL